MFQVDVLISSIVDLEDGCTNLSAANCWKNEIRLVEVESRVAGFSLNRYFHVAARDVYFCLINEEFELSCVLSLEFKLKNRS